MFQNRQCAGNCTLTDTYIPNKPIMRSGTRLPPPPEFIGGVAPIQTTALPAAQPRLGLGGFGTYAATHAPAFMQPSVCDFGLKLASGKSGVLAYRLLQRMQVPLPPHLALQAEHCQHRFLKCLY